MLMVGIKDGVVITCVSTDDPSILLSMYPEQEFVSVAEPISIGWLYINSSFFPPNDTQVDNTERITQLAFLSRFTDEEAIAIDLASQGLSFNAALLRRFQKKIDAAKFIDLSDPNTQLGVNTLEQVGLIGAGRAAQILSVAILPHEQYVGSN